MLLDTHWHEGVDALPEALGNASKLVVCLENHWKDIAFEQFPNLVLAASERKPLPYYFCYVDVLLLELGGRSNQNDSLVQMAMAHQSTQVFPAEQHHRATED